MAYSKNDIIKYQNERINQVRANRYGDIGKIIGFENNTCSQVIYTLNGQGQYKTSWTYFNRGQFNVQNRTCRIGEKKRNNQGSMMEIIAYRMSEDIDIKFESGYISYNKTYDEFKRGEIRDYYYPSICGIGYIGGNEYNGTNVINGVNLWDRWVGMITRCYKPTNPKSAITYKECTVTTEWLNFQNFAKWCESNIYNIPNETLCLDKDILLKHNKIYSPDKCCFVPAEINSLFTRRERDRGDLPIGVSINQTTGKKYYATLSRKRLGKKCYYADSIEEAFNFYKIEKELYIKYVADIYKEYLPLKIYNAMYSYEVEITD